MSTSSAPTKSLSGIQEKEDDVRVIPMTRRPDGTYRKERKVRPGYTPPEDVAKYTNTVLSSSRPAPTPAVSAVPSTPKTKTQLKNEKRKIKRKEETGTESEPSIASNTQSKETTKVEQDATTTTTTATATATREDTVEPVDAEKKLRALNKKLRQIEQLRERQDNGETLIPEQVEKISKMEEIMAQIAELII